MVRVLWVSSETPDRNGQGGQRRQFHQIRELTARGHDITVLVPRSAQNAATLREVATVRRMRFALLGVALAPLFRRASALVRSPQWDAIVLSHVESAWLIPRGVQAPVLLDVHNVLSYWHSTHGRDLEAAAARSAEAEALTIATGVMTCSATELRRLAQVHPDVLAGREAFVAPLGIDPDEWPAVDYRRDSPRVAMFGSWDWAPNAAGLEWFGSYVWPTVRRHLPDAEAHVAGSGVDPAMLPDGMQFVGRVPDLAGFTASATVVAVPVRDGVGASVKFAESLATGAAVIATTDGANAFDSPPAVVSDSADAWAEWIVQKLEHRGQERAPHPARAVALQEFTWSGSVAPIDAWLRSHSRDG